MKICGSLLLALFASVASPAFASEFHVNSTRDRLDASPGDRICSTGTVMPDGTLECTLRAALQEGNRLGRAHHIVLPPGTFQIGLTAMAADVEEHDQFWGTLSTEDANLSRDFDLKSDFWITGAGIGATIVDGAGLDRVFDVVGIGVPVAMTFEQLTISHGFTHAPGACIRNRAVRGIVYLTDVVLQGCIAFDSFGGGMFNSGAVIMNRVTFRDNGALRGGALENQSIAQIYDSTFDHNGAQPNFETQGMGGGISNQPGADLRLWRSTLSNNTAGIGGGLLNQGGASIINSTISGNLGGFRGAGIAFVGPGTASSSLGLTSSTVANNRGHGIYHSTAMPLGLLETIVAGNRDPLGTLINCEGRVDSSEESLEDANTCGLAGEGDIVNTDPLLGPLADNGGPTQTHALQLGSPALDVVESPYQHNDQRGFPRPMFGAGDIGAYEKGFELMLLIPLDWSTLFTDIFTMSDTSFRLTLSLNTAGKADEFTDARIAGVKGANGPVNVELSKDGKSLEVNGIFTPPKDAGNSTVLYLQVQRGVYKPALLQIDNVSCKCDAKPRKNPPPIVIPKAGKKEP